MGAAPIAVITLRTSARCNISSTATPVSTLCHRWTASDCSGVRPSSGPVFRLKVAYRYWHMIRCSICAAWISKFHRCSRFSTTSFVSVIEAPRAGSIWRLAIKMITRLQVFVHREGLLGGVNLGDLLEDLAWRGLADHL